MEGLNETVEHVKTDLMPDYDYDEYTRRHEEYLENKERINNEEEKSSENEKADVVASTEVTSEGVKGPLDAIEDDLSW